MIKSIWHLLSTYDISAAKDLRVLWSGGRRRDNKNNNNKKAVLSQGNRAMSQLLFLA